MLHRFTSVWRLRWDTWLRRLSPGAASESVLRQNRIFIAPTRAGMGLAGLLLLLFLASANYRLSLGFALTFLVGSCAIVDMCLTYRNLAHLFLSSGRSQPVFAGETARFALQLINRSRYDRYAVWLDGVKPALAGMAQAADVAAGDSCMLFLPRQAQARGWLAAPLVRLQTRFPLGLFRAWSYWQPDVRILVYPQPEQEAPPFPGTGRGGAEATAQEEEEVAGIRPYQAGDSHKKLAWRQMARRGPEAGGELLVKQFEGGLGGEVLWFELNRLPPQLELEARLSRLTRWVLDAEAQNRLYGLSLGERELPAASGAAHLAACLQALALYGKQP